MINKLIEPSQPKNNLNFWVAIIIKLNKKHTRCRNSWSFWTEGQIYQNLKLLLTNAKFLKDNSLSLKLDKLNCMFYKKISKNCDKAIPKNITIIINKLTKKKIANMLAAFTPRAKIVTIKVIANACASLEKNLLATRVRKLKEQDKCFKEKEKSEIDRKFPNFAEKKLKIKFWSLEFCQVTQMKHIKKSWRPVKIANF